MPQDDQDQGGGRPNWSRFCLILLGLLLLNWILGSLLVGAVRPTVSYTFFLGQVNANNVGAAAPRPVRPAGDGVPAGPARAAADPGRAHPRRAAGSRHRPGRPGRRHPGMVGADLKNLINEAALRAARRGEDRVTMADFSDSLEKIVLGTGRGIVLDRAERERTAFHESGHALLGMLTPGADPVRKISIIPRGQALGVTYQAPPPTGTATPRPTCAAGSPARWAAAPPRRSSTAT
jgi:hypothetical protein